MVIDNYRNHLESVSENENVAEELAIEFMKLLNAVSINGFYKIISVKPYGGGFVVKTQPYKGSGKPRNYIVSVNLSATITQD